MKYLLCVIAITLGLTKCHSQDLITLNNGNEIKSKVIELNEDFISYKKYNFLDGPIFNIKTKEVFMIKYENGEKDVIKRIFNGIGIVEEKLEIETSEKFKKGGIYYFESIERVQQGLIWGRSSIYFALKFESDFATATAVKVQVHDVKKQEHFGMIRDGFNNEDNFKRYFSSAVSPRGSLKSSGDKFVITFEGNRESDTITIYGEVLDSDKIRIKFDNPPIEYNVSNYDGVFELQHFN